MATIQNDHPILLFDGACTLCNRTVAFVIRHDPPPGQFRFAALQSEAGQTLQRDHGLEPDQLNTMVLIENGKAYVRSTGALRVMKRLGFPWSLAYGLIAVPKFVRDAAYRWLARRRYRWFGRHEACVTPAPEVLARFVGQGDLQSMIESFNEVRR